VTHQTFWLNNTDECDVQQNEAGKNSAPKRVQCAMAGSSIIRQLISGKIGVRHDLFAGYLGNKHVRRDT